VGRGINPMFLEGRVYGGATIGMGYALTERLIAAPALATAIYDAVGVRVKDLPITPEKLLAGLKERQKW
jgi:CO/xanthine dehydrogenase Mo-binding subunit